MSASRIIGSTSRAMSCSVGYWVARSSRAMTVVGLGDRPPKTTKPRLQLSGVEFRNQRATQCLRLEADVVGVAGRDREILVAVIGIEIFNAADEILCEHLIDASADRPA